jgi:hypothetical protein
VRRVRGGWTAAVRRARKYAPSDLPSSFALALTLSRKSLGTRNVMDEFSADMVGSESEKCKTVYAHRERGHKRLLASDER